MISGMILPTIRNTWTEVWESPKKKILRRIVLKSTYLQIRAKDKDKDIVLKSTPHLISASRNCSLRPKISDLSKRRGITCSRFYCFKKVTFFSETLLICQTRLVLALLSWQAQQGSPAPSAAWRWDVQEAGRRTRCLCPHISRPAMTSC